MRKSVLITTPFPSTEEVARRSGISPKRTEELIRLADSIVAKQDEEIAAAEKRRAKEANGKPRK